VISSPLRVAGDNGAAGSQRACRRAICAVANGHESSGFAPLQGITLEGKTSVRYLSHGDRVDRAFSRLFPTLARALCQDLACRVGVVKDPFAVGRRLMISCSPSPARGQRPRIAGFVPRMAAMGGSSCPRLAIGLSAPGLPRDWPGACQQAREALPASYAPFLLWAAYGICPCWGAPLTSA
jgi:hypothetical protein